MDRLWQHATVLSSSGDRVLLRFDRLSQCEACLRGEGCGAGVFSQLFTRSSTTVDLPSEHRWQVGQRVRVGIAPGRLMSGSIALYGWPLLGFLVGAVIAQTVGQIVELSHWASDVLSLVGGLSLAALTTWGSWQRRHHQWNPKVEALSCDAYDDRT